MRAVNLIPSESQSSGRPSLKFAPVTYALLGVLTVALSLVTLYVLAGNSVNSRKNQVTSLQSQLTQAQSESSQLASYGQFASLAQTRLQTVRGIAGTRFDWHGALADLSKVIPASTSLQSLTATVVPGANAGGGASGTGLRADLAGPAFELAGCTHTQNEVAHLVSRLRVLPEVTRVALGSSGKSTTDPGSATSTASTVKHPRGCPANGPIFNLVVFFQPVAGAGPTGVTSLPTGTAPSTANGGAQ